MNNEPRPEPLSVKELANAAANGDWGAVDGSIGQVADKEEYLRWAKAHIGDENGDLRDLSVSLYEATSRGVSEPMKTTLLELMGSDENPYVQYRSAFALFKHGSRYKPVVDKIRDALKDPDVADIARGYLDILDREPQADSSNGSKYL